MPNLFELFKYSKMLKVSDGELSLMGVPINIAPSSVLRDIQKSLIKNLGWKEAYSIIYQSAKTGSFEYNKKFLVERGFKDKRKAFDWQMNVVTFSGWGKIEAAKVDFENNSFVGIYHNSPFPKVYGKSDYPVDIISTAFTAGGVSATVGKDIDAIETKCMAMGHPFCEVELGPPDVIAKKKEELWKKWKLV